MEDPEEFESLTVHSECTAVQERKYFASRFRYTAFIAILLSYL